MKPTVLHIHFWADIRNSAGSVEKVITAFAANGAEYEHRIACCPGQKSRCEPPFRHHGVEVHHFHENLLLNRVMNKMLRRGVFTYGSLVRLINRLRPAILHFHNRQELVDALVRRLDYRPKVVVHYHRHFAKPDAPDSADLLLFISEATARDILGKTPTAKSYRVLPNPLSIELLAHARSPSTRCDEGRIPSILFGGGGNPAKGGRELVQAFLSLPPGSARLIMAGRNTDRMGIADPAIEICGEVPAAQFFSLMAGADIVAMPSYDEPFGLIAQEAMLMGKLLVTTASGGMAEFVDDNCAIVVKPRDVESLRAGLERAVTLLRNPDLEHVLETARTRIDAFRPETVISQLEAYYDDLCGTA